MINSMDIAIKRNDGSPAQAHVMPEDVAPANSGFANADTYSAMIGDEDAGRFKFSKDKTEWTYKGQLTSEEQSQIAQFIQAFREK